MALADRFLDPGPKARATYSRAVRIGLAGYQKSPLFFDDPRLPYCDDPVHLVSWVDSRNRLLPSMETAQYVPCRKCRKCLQFRQMKWRERMINEIAIAPRSWVVTLTFSPVHLAGLFMSLHEKKGSPNQQIDAVCYAEVQKYVKRLRKAKCALRYFAVFEGNYEAPAVEGEASKLHRAHYHLVVHETGRPITWRQLTDAWRRGSFSHAKLVGSSAAASYVTKYLTKSGGRVRASSRYGHPQPSKAGAKHTAKGAQQMVSNRNQTDTH